MSLIGFYNSKIKKLDLIEQDPVKLQLLCLKKNYKKIFKKEILWGILAILFPKTYPNAL